MLRGLRTKGGWDGTTKSQEWDEDGRSDLSDVTDDNNKQWTSSWLMGDWRLCAMTRACAMTGAGGMDRRLVLARFLSLSLLDYYCTSDNYLICKTKTQELAYDRICAFILILSMSLAIG
jgi:hypothetical protein